MKKILLILLLLAPIVMQAQEEINYSDISMHDGIMCYEPKNNPFTGIIIEVDSNKNVTRSYIKDGIRTGQSATGNHAQSKNTDSKAQVGELKLETEYYENGAVKSRVYYKSNSIQDYTKEIYYPNGQIKTRSNFHRGIKSGRTTEYHPNGVIKAKFDYTNGHINGLFRNYYENGKLKTKLEVRDNIADGYFSSYYENGVLHKSTTFKDGILANDFYKEWHPNGKPYKTKRYDYKGRPHGQHKTYYSTGLTETVESYLDGDRHGTNENFRSDGSLSSTFSYVYGDPYIHRTYDTARILTQEILYQKIFNKDNGIEYIVNEYYPDNVLKSESHYKSGKLYRIKTYDSNGKRIKN